MAVNNNTEITELNQNTVDDELNEIVDFVPLRYANNYEMLNIEPHTIRQIKIKRIIKEFNHCDDYRCLHLNGKFCYKHKLIGEQFLDNPNDYKYVDHIDGNRKNNSLSNLRWVNNSQNVRNRVVFNKQFENEIFDEISDESIRVLDYVKRKFEDGVYYFNDDIFYKFNCL
jgi:hypothetical protein